MSTSPGSSIQPLASEIVRTQKEHLWPALTPYYAEPIALERGEGPYVWDDAGRKYLDAFGGVLTVSVGHANPRVVNAIVEQVRKISHTSTLYANSQLAGMAEKMAQIAPKGMGGGVVGGIGGGGRGPAKSFFTSSGSEANETAMNAARHATGRMELVVLRHSYSGRTSQALAACGQHGWKKLPPMIAGIHHAHAPYCYRCPFGASGPHNCSLECANDIEELIQTSTTGEIAAFMAETIIGSGGFIVPPPGYFERATAIARKYGGLFIADEVQTAWGRTGGKWWGIEHWDVTPDLITSAKGMGNGAPVAVTIATPEVAAKYPGITFATFGGNPVSMAAARSTIQVIEEDGLLENCRTVGAYLGEKFAELKTKHAIIGDARGMGMMQALELVKDRKTKEPNPAAVGIVFEECKKRGVLIGKGGVWGNVIRTGMMLNSSKAEVDELVAALDGGLAVASGAVG